MNFRAYVRERLSLAIARREEIVEELAQHLDDVYREAREAGLDEAAARARAAGAFPAAADELARALRSASRNPQEQIADRWHAHLDEPIPARQGALTMLTDFRRDFRYALRTLSRAPGFTAVVTLTMALGIGATAAIFSAVDAILLKSLPVSDPDRVVHVYTKWAASATTNASAGDQLGNASFPDFVDLRESGTLESLAAFGEMRVSLDHNGVTEQVEGVVATGNYFDVLGVSAVVGRTFRPEEDRAGSPIRVAVVSHLTWQRRFGGDTTAVGRSITLNGKPYLMIGVAPRGFGGPSLGHAPELWVPMALQEEVRPPSAGALRQRLGTMNLLGFRDVRWLSMVGRLRKGTTAADGATALDVIGRRLAAAYPTSNRDLSATAVPLGEGPGVRASTRPVLSLLVGAVTLLLLISCANVAGLLIARAVTRRREVAVRLAIGAGRGQLVRQWLTEAVILGVLGAAAGALLAARGTPLLFGFGIPEGIDLSLNGRVLAFTLAIGVATGLLFGLAPVVHLIRRDSWTALREEGGAVALGARTTRLLSAFVVLQVALSLILLVGAGLFIRTLQQAYAVDLGYRVDRMLVAEISTAETYTPAAAQAFYRQLLDRLKSVPGVAAAGAARVTVLSGGSRTLPVSLDGQPFRPGSSNMMIVRANVVTDGYLDAMGIPIVRGRGFESSDGQGSPRVAIVSRSLADRLWPKADPIGQTLLTAADRTPGNPGSGGLQVIGVVPDTVYRSATERDPRPFYYVPLAQNYEAAVTLHLRTEGDPLALVPAVRRAVRDLDPRLAVARPRRLLDEFDRSMAGPRSIARLAGILSAVALSLAAVGLYGVMAYTARQRTTEVGLRLALGATPLSILNLIAGRGARLVGLGAALGLAGALASARLVRSYLFGVEPTDLITWLAVSAMLVIVGLVACAIPAHRAMRVDPAAALRSS